MNIHSLKPEGSLELKRLSRSDHRDVRGVIPGSEVSEIAGPFPDNGCAHVTEQRLFNISFLPLATFLPFITS